MHTFFKSAEVPKMGSRYSRNVLKLVGIFSPTHQKLRTTTLVLYSYCVVFSRLQSDRVHTSSVRTNLLLFYLFSLKDELPGIYENKNTADTAHHRNNKH